MHLSTIDWGIIVATFLYGQSLPALILSGIAIAAAAFIVKLRFND